ncbi:hypothetical protein NFI96_011888 [Prochilodus magdalenae]|nr:hypothetical protein NFI96_011888 [Prochilodus magdalenae]
MYVLNRSVSSGFSIVPPCLIFQQNCVSMGGHLASVHSSEEYGFMQALVLHVTNSNSPTWLGGTDSAQEGVWVWTDGSTFDYNNWSTGQPDYLNVSENCIQMNFPENWNNIHCGSLFPSVCAKCQNGWSQFGSRCFRIFTEAAAWMDSEYTCMTMGGHLASVHSDEEYTFIQDLVLNTINSSSPVWLGATDALQDGVWVWTDGSAFNYNNWNYGLPDAAYSSNCLLLNFPVNWNNVDCYAQFSSVCASHVMAVRLKVLSNRELTASDNPQLLLQQLIDGRLPSTITLRLRSIKKNSP